MKNNFPKIPLFLSILFFIVFSSVFVLLYREINNNSRKVENSIITLQTEAKRREDIISLNKSINKITNDKILLEAHFAKNSDIVPFLDAIEKLGPQVGAKVQVESVDVMAKGAGLMVGLKTSGSFESIYTFLRLLENSPYELDFTFVEISKLPGSDVVSKNIKSSVWEAVFNIQLLSFIP